MRMNLGDKDFKVSVRVNESQYQYLSKLASDYRCTVSDCIRLLVNMQLSKENNNNENTKASSRN